MKKYLLPLLTLLMGFVLTISVYFTFASDQQQITHEVFQQTAHSEVAVVEEIVARTIAALSTTTSILIGVASNWQSI